MSTTTLQNIEERPAFLQTGLSIFDEGIFTSIMRVADAMAHSPLVPESLRTQKVNGKTEALPIEQIRANCFLVTEQAQRWGISPFAAIACASNIHGRLMWEGKLVAGILESNLGVRLNYQYTGTGDGMTVVVSGTIPGEDVPRTVKGTVADWKTDQWKGSAYEQRLAYRGAREWARRHAPSIMLGVVTDDDEAPQMRDVTDKARVVISEDKQVDPFSGTKLEGTAKAASEPKAAPKEADKPNDEQPQEAAETEQPEPSAETAEKDATFIEVIEKQFEAKGGKKATRWFETIFHIQSKRLTFYTFSTSLAESLRENEKGTDMRITLKPSTKAGAFTLVDYRLAENGKGGLLV
jgi:hypothetical protein